MINAILLVASIPPAPDFYIDEFACYRYATGHYECAKGEIHKICKKTDDNTIKCTREFIPCVNCEDA